MRAIRWLIFVAVAISAVAWWRSHSSTRPGVAREPVELARRVISDIAATDGGRIRWHVHAMPNREGTQDGVSVHNVQDAAADVDNYGHIMAVDTPTWGIVLHLARITEIVCVREFIHDPPPGFVQLYFSFRKGPDNQHGYPDELFTVGFSERAPEFERICDKHRLRRDDDRDRR